MTILESGTTQEERVRVGPQSELRHDRGNQSLRLHDGSTAGGHEFLPRATNDSLYAAKTLDLAALADPGKDSLGFMARVGQGSYRYRNFGVNTQNLTLTNGSGSAGNPTFGLKPTITSTHTFTQNTTFSGGLTGDLTGDVTGNVTGDVTGNLTGDSAGAHTGALDARGESVQLDDGALAIAHVNGLQAALDALVFSLPTGLIMMWSGSAASIPAGWALCDGTNGTPNLMNSFVRGAGGDYAPGDTGGAATHVHTATAADAGAHQHSVTVDGHTLTVNQMPAHKHTSGVTDNSQNLVFNRGAVGASPSTSNAIESNSDNGIYEPYTSEEGGGQPHAHTASSGSAGNHTHAITVEAQDNIPPYYALCYIMHVG